MLRLAHKYETTSILATLISVFAQKYARLTFPDTMTSDEPCNILLEGDSSAHESFLSLRDDLDYTVANVLEETNNISLLPGALYICAIVRTPLELLNSPLSATNKQRVMNSLPALHAALHAQILSTVVAANSKSDPASSGRGSSFCQHHARSCCLSLTHSWAQKPGSPMATDHPLMRFSVLPPSCVDGMCATVALKAKAHWNKEVDGLWRKLPALFLLETWSHLNTQDLKYRSEMQKDSLEGMIKNMRLSKMCTGRVPRVSLLKIG